MTTIFEYTCIKCGVHRLKSCPVTDKEIHEICKNWECPNCGSVVSQWQFVDIVFVPNKEQDQEQLAKFGNLPFGLENLNQVNDKLESIDRSPLTSFEEQAQFDLVSYFKRGVNGNEWE